MHVIGRKFGAVPRAANRYAIAVAAAHQGRRRRLGLFMVCKMQGLLTGRFIARVSAR